MTKRSLAKMTHRPSSHVDRAEVSKFLQSSAFRRKLQHVARSFGVNCPRACQRKAKPGIGGAVNDLCEATFDFGIRAVFKPEIRASYVTFESHHITAQIELDDFFTSPAE